MSDLARSLTLEMGCDNHEIISDPHYEASNGMFGGWTAAMLLRAMLHNQPDNFRAATLNLSFLKRINPGQNLKIQCHTLHSGKSIIHRQATLRAAESILAVATSILAQTTPGHLFTQPEFPEIPPYTELARIALPGKLDRTSSIWPAGRRAGSANCTCSLSWVSEGNGKLDYLHLAYLADLFVPKIMNIDPAVYSSTLSMTINFFANECDLDKAGIHPVISETFCTSAANSTIGSRCNLWSKCGTLLAASDQVCWFK